MTDPFVAVPPPGVPVSGAGTSLREWYAGLAMLAVSDKSLRQLIDAKDQHYEEIARGAVKLADALIAELKRTGA